MNIRTHPSSSATNRSAPPSTMSPATSVARLAPRTARSISATISMSESSPRRTPYAGGRPDGSTGPRAVIAGCKSKPALAYRRVARGSREHSTMRGKLGERRRQERRPHSRRLVARPHGQHRQHPEVVVADDRLGEPDNLVRIDGDPGASRVRAQETRRSAALADARRARSSSPRACRNAFASR